jgi:hypothetical protein
MGKTRKSFTAKKKLEIIEYAKIHGNRKAGREFSCDESCIRDWRKSETVLKVMPKNKRALRKGISHWPELENKLKSFVLEMRSQNLKVSTVDIRLKAQQIATDDGINDFTGPPGWCHRFMKRHGFTIRSVTSTGQSLPSDWRERMASFRLYYKEKANGIPLSQIGNMDEVPCCFDIPDKRTIEVKGTQDVLLKTTGNEKTHFTIVLCVTADGGKCDPMVIFKRKTFPKKLEFPKGIVVAVQPKAWIDKDLMKVWLNNVWRKRSGSFFQNKSLLVYDSARAHLTDEVKYEVHKFSNLAVIPGGMTKLLQPLDLTVNKSFKHKMRKEWEKWIKEGYHSYTKSEKMRKASLIDVCNWIIKSWEEITPQCIKNGFSKAFEKEISLVSNEEEQESDSDTEVEEVDIESDELLSIKEMFEIESDNEEFDGF